MSVFVNGFIFDYGLSNIHLRPYIHEMLFFWNGDRTRIVTLWPVYIKCYFQYLNPDITATNFFKLN